MPPLILTHIFAGTLSSPRAATTPPVLAASRSHEPLRPPDLDSPLSESPFTTPLTTLPNGTSRASEQASTAPPQTPTRTDSLSLLDSSTIISSDVSVQSVQASKPLQQPTAVAAQSPPVAGQPASTTAASSPFRQSSLLHLHSQTLVSSPSTLPVPSFENRPLARESRISLPDEARRYIQESLSPSPRQTTFPPGTTTGYIVEEPTSLEAEVNESREPGSFDISTVPIQSSDDQAVTQTLDAPNASPNKPAAFLELNDDEDKDMTETLLDEQDLQTSLVSQMDSTGSSQQQAHHSPGDLRPTPQVLVADNVPYRSLPSLVTFVSDASTLCDSSIAASDVDTMRASPISPGGSRSTPPPTVGGAPLATARVQASSTTQAQVQAQRMAYAQAHHQEYNQLPRGQPAPQPSGAGPVYGNPSARARLTESDLKHCKVSVVGSNIRANERGKEVLSFVVQVSPSGSPDAADSWKVEKLYSEVLSLDARIRGRLSRSDLKKLGSLPDNRLFKDHAPAKVDQRKVSMAVSHMLFIDILMALI